MSAIGHPPELDLLRKQVADLARKAIFWLNGSEFRYCRLFDPKFLEVGIIYPFFV